MNPLLIIGTAVSLLVSQGVVVLKPLQALLNPSNTTTQQAQVAFHPVDYQVAPSLKTGAKPYNAQASSALIYDVDSGQMLYQKNIENPRAIASLTKLMTALVILENHSLDETVTIPELPALQAEDQKIGVTPSEQFKLRDLLKGLLIYSANDVANSLAIWDSGSIESFSVKMNQKAAEWSLQNSHFVNPSGLDAAGNHSSAKDLQVLATILMHNQKFLETVKTANDSITNLSGKHYTLTTTNKLLGTDGVIGVKTGLTLEAGQCLVTLSQHDGHRIITVVLDSPDRFQESKNMIDWAFSNHIWQ